MTKLEKTVEALRRCVPAAEFEKAMAEVEKVEAPATHSSNTVDVENLIHDLLTELGTPAHLIGYRYLVTALRLIVEDPGIIDTITFGLYPKLAAMYDTSSSRVERALRHLIEVTWTRADWDVLRRYFGNTIHPEKGKPTNGEFMARMGVIIRRKVKESQ